MVDAVTFARELAAGGFTVDERTGCWLWHDRAPTGYGPHLASWESAFGAVPAGLTVVHTCHGGPRGCVRPAHLDVMERGRSPARPADATLAGEEAAWFAARLRDERDARGVTRAQLARELGVSQHALGRWEDAHGTPTVAEAHRLATGLGWDGPPARWVVTAAVSRVVVAGTAGQAARAVRDELERDDQPGKLAMGTVRRVD